MVVQVYFNLHKCKWSIRDKRSRLVIGHVDRLVLADPCPKVSIKGQDRVRSEKCKNVHAWIEGRLVDLESTANTRSITYNPYKYDTFVYCDTKEEFKTASYAVFTQDRQVKVIP